MLPPPERPHVVTRWGQNVIVPAAKATPRRGKRVTASQPAVTGVTARRRGANQRVPGETVSAAAGAGISGSATRRRRGRTASAPAAAGTMTTRGTGPRGRTAKPRVAGQTGTVTGVRPRGLAATRRDGRTGSGQ
ncbi:MAG TPA: hypothetical protein VGY50_08880, partial [Streptosporangiaceae bacterium]|nr:hypothetical protein [Streptosporangiaceae bacterium]